ncbi:hypothetical protein PoB_006858600 [Plakobranchus ocellatus]|uniref:Uncharacterized protein n=1 Tax=Plakobranchus ocellatus TaxID=259542 RepID=A0AAV4DDB9_9GAST|nr:hypothetical protein PoB_006858600 [Plakobranchus ocellatus]
MKVQKEEKIEERKERTDDGIPPVLTVNIADVELQEKEDARTPLGAGPVVTCEDADGDPVRAYIDSLSPTSGCGLTCLQLEPCGAGGTGGTCQLDLQKSLDQETKYGHINGRSGFSGIENFDFRDRYVHIEIFAAS